MTLINYKLIKKYGDILYIYFPWILINTKHLDKFCNEATIKYSILRFKDIQLFLHFTRTSRQNVAAVVWFSTPRIFPYERRDTIFYSHPAKYVVNCAILSFVYFIFPLMFPHYSYPRSFHLPIVSFVRRNVGSLPWRFNSLRQYCPSYILFAFTRV